MPLLLYADLITSGIAFWVSLVLRLLGVWDLLFSEMASILFVSGWQSQSSGRLILTGSRNERHGCACSVQTGCFTLDGAPTLLLLAGILILCGMRLHLLILTGVDI